MGLFVKIAFRNLFRHRGRSLVIGVILFAGALVMALGNGIISGMEKGFEAHIVQHWTGHLVVVSARQRNDDVLFNPKPMKVIRHYPGVESILESTPDVASFLPAAKGLALVLNIGARKKATELPLPAILLGVDFPRYREMFGDNLTLMEGAGLKADDKGLLLNTREREKIYESEHTWLLPAGTAPDPGLLPPGALQGPGPFETGASLVLMGIGDDNSALDVLVDVKGIYAFNALNLLFKEINIIDIESFRECFNHVTRADHHLAVSRENRDLLAAPLESLDRYFSDGALVDAGAMADAPGTEALKEEVKSGGANPATSSEAYTLVFVKLRNGGALEASQQRLNTAFQAKAADARAISWEQAVGYIADLALLFRVALNIVVSLIFFVAVIILINTLSMNAMERAPEIGTMRAMGAQKGFIRGLFLTETALLSLLFGGAGLVAGALVILLTAGLGVPAANEMMSLAFGGDTFRPQMDLQGMTNVSLQLIGVTLVAALYPVHLATRVSPLDAVARD